MRRSRSRSSCNVQMHAAWHDSVPIQQRERKLTLDIMRLLSMKRACLSTEADPTRDGIRMCRWEPTTDGISRGRMLDRVVTVSTRDSAAMR